MTLEIIEKASKINKRLKAVDESLETLRSQEAKSIRIPLLERNSVWLGPSIAIDRMRLLTFLEGEKQFLNLELHTLGVELPGVPQIGEAQAVTKGMDQ